MQITNGSYCVYVHIFPNGKVYVGITGDPPHRRWKSNGYGYHGQRVIYNAIKKYGWDNIQHEIVASNLTKEEACNFEIILIRAFNSTNHDYGYNVDCGGRTSGSHSPETKKKMSETMKQVWRSDNYKRVLTEESIQKMKDAKKDMYLGADNPAARSVICIDTGKVFPTIRSAAKAKGLCKDTISKYLSHKSNGGGGYRWEYCNKELNVS